MNTRIRFLLLILFATLILALVAGLQFVERRDAEIAAARRETGKPKFAPLALPNMEKTQKTRALTLPRQRAGA